MRRSVSSVLVAGIAAVLDGCSSGPDQALRVATGAVTHFVCSQAFVSGEDPDQVYADTFGSIPGIWLLDWAMRYNVDSVRRQATATLAGGFSSLAVYRDGVGCIIVHGDEPVAGYPAEDSGALADSLAPLLPEIARPTVVEPADPKLRAALDLEFAEPDHPPLRHTKAVVVVHDGRVVAERYAPGFGIDTPILGNSLTKSVTNALVGVLVREGRLAVEKAAPVAVWGDPGDPRRDITLDELLRMQSGLDLGNSLDATLSSLWNPSNRMLFLERDMAKFAESAALEAKPGTLWNYSDGNYLIVSRIIRDAVGGRMADVLAFARRELFDPLGMRRATLEFDATGTPLGSGFMLASARDWARLGLLYLDDGVVAGRRILPRGWVGYSSGRHQMPGSAMGRASGPISMRATAPRTGWARACRATSFFGRGKFGQYIIVVPSARLVVVRLGVTHGWEDIDGVSRLTANVIGALDRHSAGMSSRDAAPPTHLRQ